jgi:hypothetical protein
MSSAKRKSSANRKSGPQYSSPSGKVVRNLGTPGGSNVVAGTNGRQVLEHTPGGQNKAWHHEEAQTATEAECRAHKVDNAQANRNARKKAKSGSKRAATVDERAEKLGLETPIFHPQSMSQDELEVKRWALLKQISRAEQAPEKKVEERDKSAQHMHDLRAALKAKAPKEKADADAAQRKRNMDDVRKAHDQIGRNWLAAEQRALPDSYFPGVSEICATLCYFFAPSLVAPTLRSLPGGLQGRSHGS